MIRSPLNSALLALVLVAGCAGSSTPEIGNGGGDPNTNPNAGVHSGNPSPPSTPPPAKPVKDDPDSGSPPPPPPSNDDAGPPPPPPADASPGLMCNPGEQACGTSCVSVNDPAYGCGDPSCGACGSANATAGCAQGQCVINKCNRDWADCDGNAANGCETHLTDNDNCGACGNQCGVQTLEGHAIAKCFDIGIGPACGMLCDPGWADCNGDPSDGCEVNTDNDTNNCGGCGAACSGTCSQGTCN